MYGIIDEGREDMDRRTLIKGRWRYWRKMQEISQARVARLCGVSRATVARWDDPKCRLLPDVSQLVTICEALRIKADMALLFLMGGGLNGKS